MKLRNTLAATTAVVSLGLAGVPHAKGGVQVAMDYLAETAPLTR